MMSSLFIGATGLKSHSEGMSVVSNNLANVNTVAFKQVMMLYQDLTSLTVPARSNAITNMAQAGRGSHPGEVRRLFTQGGFEKGSEATDLAIEGLGFFGVHRNNQIEYTRAGNFRFTPEGRLNDPNGWTLLGHAISNGVEAKDATPIQINLGLGGAGAIPAKATTRMTAYSNLGGISDERSDATNPFFAMASAWNGTKNPPMPGRTSYKEAIDIYDANGNHQNAFIYYDLAAQSAGQKVVEYMIAIDPNRDASAAAGTANAGLLMAGTMTFDPSGQLHNVTAYTPPSSGNLKDLNNWSPAQIVNGNPAFQVTFAGSSSQTIGFDMGLSLPGSSIGVAAAQSLTNPSAFLGPLAGAKRKDTATSAFASTLTSKFQDNDGYPEGFLRELEVNAQGVVVGKYSNNQTQDLYRIGLYRFTSQDGLRHEGDNHFSATNASGETQEGVAGTENYGRIASNVIEQSNVDYAREFATMIITQRGFQMNSKVITTSDQMLQKALELKRT